MPSVAAFATILDHNEKVLLLRRRDIDVWETPGGGTRTDEAPWEAVVREVREETALTVLVERLTGVYWRPNKPAIVFQFLCTITGGIATPSAEASEIRYFAFGALPERVTPVVRERIEDCLRSEPVFRTQEGPGAQEFIPELQPGMPQGD